DCRRKDRTRLFGIHNPPDVQSSGIEKLIWIELLQRRRVDQPRLHVPSNGYDGSTFLERVKQSIDQMCTAGTGGTAYGNRAVGQVGIGNRRERAVFLVPDMNEFDLPISSKCRDRRIERVTDDAVTTLHSCAFQHFPKQISYCLCHTEYLQYRPRDEP